MVKTNKRILSLILAIVMVMGLGVTAFAEEAQTTSSNVKVDALVEAGLVTGDAGGLRLEDPITRAEVAAMLVRALGEEELSNVMKGIKSSFTDLTVNHWANGYVNIVSSKGIVAGYPDGSFGPDKNINYNEVITMLVRAVGPLTPIEEASGKWPTNYLLKASSLGILEGVDIVNFKEQAVREKVFEAIYNAVQLRGDSLIVGNKVEAVVVENSRVSNVDADEIVLKVVKNQAKKEDDSEFVKGDEITLKLTEDLKKLGDSESLLGKGVLVSLDAKGEVLKVELNPNYTVVQGQVEDIKADRIKVDSKWYDVEVDTKEQNSLLVAFYNNEEVDFEETKDNDDFMDLVLAGEVNEFVRLTIKNGDVIFAEAFDFEDVAFATKSIDSKFVVEYANDVYDGETSKLYDLDDALVLSFEKGELKNSTHTAIKAGDVLQWFETEDDDLVVIVRPVADNNVVGEYKDLTAKKVVGSTELEITVGSDEFKIVIDNSNRNAVYTSTTLEDFRALTTDYADELAVFEKEQVTLAKDIFDNVQAIIAEDGGVRGYAIIEKILGGEVKLVTDNGKDEYYKLTVRDTDFYFEDGTRAKASDFGSNDLVKVLINKDTVTEMTLIDETVEAIDNITKDVVKFEDGSFKYLGKNVVLFDVTGKAPKVITLKEFEKNYDIDEEILGFIALNEKSSNTADVIVITSAESDINVDTDEVIAKVVSFRISGTRISLTIEDARGEETTHTVKSDDVADALRNNEIEADSIVKVFISDDEDKVVVDIVELIDEDAPIYKVNTVSTRDNTVTLSDRFGDTIVVKLARTTSEFGIYKTNSFVAIGDIDATYGTIDLIVVRDVTKATADIVTPDELAAKAAVDKIKLIPSVSALALADEAKVVAARTAYDGLTIAQKALVTSVELTTLTNAEAKIVELKTPVVDKSLLKATIVDAEALVEAEHTVATWTPFAVALADAKTVDADANATQIQVDNAKDNLLNAIAALEII